VIGRYWTFVSIATLALAASSVDAGVLGRKPKIDTQKVKVLIDTLRNDADENKRKAAAAELGDYDPKGDLNVLSALIGTLQRDTSEIVRREAANVLGDIKPYSAQAGLALERTADSDRSPLVKAAAREALWEYHLNGYKSQKLAEMVMYQTAEPPLAKAAPIRPTGFVPQIVLTPEGKVRGAVVQPMIQPVPTMSLPPLVSPPGLLVPLETSPVERKVPDLITRPMFPLNRTDEPPFAKKRPAAFEVPPR
jgi:hypothetical protein